ncbi:MAG: Gldg family protein [Polyangiales bacterium]
MSDSKKTSSLLATGLLLTGLCAVFVGQRILGEGRAHDLVGYSGLGLLLVAGALRARAWAFANGDVRGVESRLLGAYAGVGVSLLLYAFSTEWGLGKLGLQSQAATRASAVLTALWLTAMAVSLSAILFMELVYLRMPIAASVELRRVRAALHAGLTLGLSIVFLLCVNYIATARDVRKDVSYFRTTQPSGSTRSMIAKLDQPMRVLLFFRQGSDVVGQVKPYFEALQSSSKKLKVQVIDVALAPALATKHKVRDNGEVLLVQGEADKTKAESFHVGNDLTEARATLRKLDGTFQQSFRKLVRPERTLYVTVGHGEHNGKATEQKAEDGTSTMDEILRRLNLKTQDIGLADGLGTLVPPTASAVMIVGPSEKFMPEEANTLLAYARKGGKLLLMLDPDKDVGLSPLLEGLGVELLPGIAVSDTYHMAHNYNDSDRGAIFSNLYSAHPIVTTASRHQREVATVLVNAAGLKQSNAKVEPKPKVTFPLHSEPQFWRDLDGNFKHDANEPIETLNLIAAVTLGEASDKSVTPIEGRAVIVGDGDFMTNKVAANNGNVLVFVDSLAWLIGNEDLTGETSSEEDIAIEHSREQDKVWFYATTFLMPAPILFGGLMVARRRRRRAEKKA